jgi:predicted membrane-bound spermidine synthase
MPLPLKVLIFCAFLISGFCGLLYQVVWIRMAYASFGIITPVMSVIISVFMLGLLLGSATGGYIVENLNRSLHVSALLCYACIEFLIGCGAFCVPRIFGLGQRYLLPLGGMDSLRYLLASGFTIAVSILPFCILMGFTYPFMMAFIKKSAENSASSFSFLYLANVVGAMCGTLITSVVLVELFGFTSTLLIAAICNGFIALMCLCADRFYKLHREAAASEHSGPLASLPGEYDSGDNRGFIRTLLFLTGFASMGMEVIWVRGFTPVLQTNIYSFSSLLASYLLASWIGSALYRRHLSLSKVWSVEKLVAGLSVFSFLPIVLTDPRLEVGVPTVLLSICPFCATLGYLTPHLIDRFARGLPSPAGKAYAINIAGCILGPLVASYVFLPYWGVKVSLIILAAPFLIWFMLFSQRPVFSRDWTVVTVVLSLFLFYQSCFVYEGYEEVFARTPGAVVRRDHTATVVSYGQGLVKRLLVNGIGITHLTPITKIMAHLPLAYSQKPPESGLAICLGMGTTFRSLASWGIRTTAVELCPSVKQAMGFYFSDADSLLKGPLTDVVIDDGRRFLMRTNRRFDVITVDPPPPLEAAGSSLLYSVEFYELAKRRLNEGGILQQWFPPGELLIVQAGARSLSRSFPYIRVFSSIEGWGFHFLASMQPIRSATARDMVDRMPGKAREDMMEWYENKDAESLMKAMLTREIPLEKLLSNDRRLAITDARPFNEYFVLRRVFGSK